MDINEYFPKGLSQGGMGGGLYTPEAIKKASTELEEEVKAEGPAGCRVCDTESILLEVDKLTPYEDQPTDDGVVHILPIRILTPLRALLRLVAR